MKDVLMLQTGARMTSGTRHVFLRHHSICCAYQTRQSTQNLPNVVLLRTCDSGNARLASVILQTILILDHGESNATNYAYNTRKYDCHR